MNEETREKIERAFMQIYAEERIEKITIRQITDLAGLNRGTFYTYYKDIYDLLEKVEERFISEISALIKKIIPAVIKGDPGERIKGLEEFYEKNNDIVHLFFGRKTNPEMIDRIKLFAKSIVRNCLPLPAPGEDQETEYIMEYIASAQIGVITYWLAHDRDMETPKLADFISRINHSAPLGMLSSHAVYGSE